MNPELIKLLLRLAAKYRKQNPEMSDCGWTVIWHGGYFASGALACEVSGWVRDLDRPASWRPGCYAVPHDGGAILLASGGDYQSGAREWKPAQTAVAA